MKLSGTEAMKKSMILVFAAWATVCGSVAADDGLSLAEEKECLTCHAIDHDTLSPSFQTIALKYNGVRNGEGAIFNKIMNGSSIRNNVGAENGAMRMPPPSARARLTKAEAERLTTWILSLKK